MRPKFGIRIRLYEESFEPVRERVLTAERLGFDAIWVNDHLLPIVGTAHRPMMECWTILSALASVTERIRLGALVLNNTFRHPQVLAKMACTLDRVSRGRLELGLGAGWFRQEHEMFGLEFGSHSERIRMLEESIELLKLLWTEEKTATFNGRFYRVKDAVCLPKPFQRPHPPLLIGGNSGGILDLMARHADNSNFLLISSRDFSERSKMLEERCRKIGRDFSKIRKSYFGECMVAGTDAEAEDEVRERLRERGISADRKREYGEKSIIGTPEKCVERINEYARAGAEEFMLVFAGKRADQIRIFADSVMPCLERG